MLIQHGEKMKIRINGWRSVAAIFFTLVFMSICSELAVAQGHNIEMDVWSNLMIFFIGLLFLEIEIIK